MIAQKLGAPVSVKHLLEPLRPSHTRNKCRLWASHS